MDKIQIYSKELVISKPHLPDTLRAKVIVDLMKVQSKEVQECLHAMFASIVQTLGVKSTPGLIVEMVEDAIEVYGYESMEDISLCLRNGRQGKYGTIYNKFNFIVFREWMTKHLEEKAILREREVKKAMHDWATYEEYVNSIEVGKKMQKELVQKKNKLADYERYRSEYLGKRMVRDAHSGKEKTVPVPKGERSKRKD